MNEKLKHGDIVVIDARHRCYKTDRKRWPIKKLPKTEGIYLGKRVIKEGTTEWEDHGAYFFPSKYITAGYVSINLTENPIYVPLENIKLKAESPQQCLFLKKL